MKTKISHLGRSTVSVILAVMMLLSTMLIGTITTANAVDIQYYYRGSDNNWGASAMTQSTDGKYFYIQSSSATNQFKIANSTTTYDYNSTYVQKDLIILMCKTSVIIVAMTVMFGSLVHIIF